MLDYLCEFSFVARLNSFSLAAEELFISQSSLSKHIMALEKELGVKLFIRKGNKISLSQAGIQALPFAKEMIEIKNDVINIAEQNKTNQSILKIASIPVMAIYDITGAITKFKKAFPEINLSVSEYGISETSKSLKTGECDLAFIHKRLEESQIFEFIPFYKDHLVAVLPRAHPLSNANKLNLLQLKNEDFLFMDSKTEFSKLLFALCSKAGFIPKVKYTGRGETIVDLVSQGMGITLLMKRHTDYYRNPGIISINVIPAVENEICLARLKSRSLSSTAQMFWNYIRSRQ